jgi:hypothetical protein
LREARQALPNQPIYYINYIDPETGFLRREEFMSHRERDRRMEELRRKGVKHITTGH